MKPLDVVVRVVPTAILAIGLTAGEHRVAADCSAQCTNNFWCAGNQGPTQDPQGCWSTGDYHPFECDMTNGCCYMEESVAAECTW